MANGSLRSDGILSDPNKLLFIKPCKPAEIEFYESATKHPKIQYYMSTFLGQVAFAQDVSDSVSTALLRNAGTHLVTPHSANAQNPSTAAESWTPSNRKIDSNLGIVLENVVAELKQPNVLDVKLGSRLWADDAPAAKRQRLDEVAAVTTSKPLGFRIAGMKTYMGPKSAGQVGFDPRGFQVYDKEYGRSLNVDTVKEGFRKFFFVPNGGITTKFSRRLIRRFLDDLRGLQEALENEESRMYSSSLLLVYEGDGSQLQQDFQKEKEVLGRYHESEPAPDLNGYLDHSAPRDESNGHRDQSQSHHDPSNGHHDPSNSHHDPTPPSNGHTSQQDPTDEDSDLSDSENPLPKVWALKMIDFAHAEWTPGQGPDENVLHGIRNVIEILDALLDP